MCWRGFAIGSPSADAEDCHNCCTCYGCYQLITQVSEPLGQNICQALNPQSWNAPHILLSTIFSARITLPPGNIQTGRVVLLCTSSAGAVIAFSFAFWIFSVRPAKHDTVHSAEQYTLLCKHWVGIWKITSVTFQEDDSFGKFRDINRNYNIGTFIL